MSGKKCTLPAFPVLFTQSKPSVHGGANRSPLHFLPFASLVFLEFIDNFSSFLALSFLRPIPTTTVRCTIVSFAYVSFDYGTLLSHFCNRLAASQVVGHFPPAAERRPVPKQARRSTDHSNAT
jgi:hypothetical protein